MSARRAAGGTVSFSKNIIDRIWIDDGIHYSVSIHSQLVHLSIIEIERLNPDGTQTTLAAFFDGKRINSPNDLAFGPVTNDLYLCVTVCRRKGGKGDGVGDTQAATGCGCI